MNQKILFGRSTRDLLIALGPILLVSIALLIISNKYLNPAPPNRVVISTSDDEGDPTGEVVYSLSKGLRDILKHSTIWGRIQAQVMFAFTSKYALSLYELLQKRVNLSHVWSEEFEIDDFRKLMGVPDDKLTQFFSLNAYCIKPALLEVNGLADHGVSLEPLRRGKTVYAIKMSWWKKSRHEREIAYAELQRPKVGRLPRLKGTVEHIVRED